MMSGPAMLEDQEPASLGWKAGSVARPFHLFALKVIGIPTSCHYELSLLINHVYKS